MEIFSTPLASIKAKGGIPVSYKLFWDEGNSKSKVDKLLPIDGLTEGKKTLNTFDPSKDYRFTLQASN
jgi:hypothetical protein